MLAGESGWPLGHCAVRCLKAAPWERVAFFSTVLISTSCRVDFFLCLARLRTRHFNMSTIGR
jgi:hypothetical protein